MTGGLALTRLAADIGAVRSAMKGASKVRMCSPIEFWRPFFIAWMHKQGSKDTMAAVNYAGKEIIGDLVPSAYEFPVVAVAFKSAEVQFYFMHKLRPLQDPKPR